MHMGCREKMQASCDERNALDRVVHRDREMVARRRVLAGQNHVAEYFRRHPDLPLPSRSVQVARDPNGSACLDAARKSCPRRSGRRFGRVQTANPRIYGAVRSVGRRTRGLDLPFDVLARAEAGIKQAVSPQPIKRPPVVGHVVGLSADGFVPVRPSQLGSYRLFRFRSATTGVDIFQA